MFCQVCGEKIDNKAVICTHCGVAVPPKESRPNNQFKINDTVSTLDWFFSRLFLSIPIIGFILLIVWAFSSSIPKSKSNYAKAALAWYITLFVFIMMIFIMALWL